MVKLEALAHLPVRSTRHGDRAWTEKAPNYAEVARLSFSERTNDDLDQIGLLRDKYFILGIGYLEQQKVHTLAFGNAYSQDEGVFGVLELPLEKIMGYAKFS